jgi:hypothetical protein
MISSAIRAETFTDRIHSIEKGIIKFENGRVAFLDGKKINVRPNQMVEIKVTKTLSLKSILKKASFPTKEKIHATNNQKSFEPPFEASLVPSMKEAWNIFNRSNSDYKRISECSDRAHVWAHDEFKFSGIKSKKVFVFFTASYINSVRFKWWFHVAPLYNVNDQGLIKEMVMDYRYTDRPMSVKEWTDTFVYTGRPCKVTGKFSEYDINPQTEDCYLMYESMHYKIPAELSDQEILGKYKTSTSEFEIRQAKNQGFQ